MGLQCRYLLVRLFKLGRWNVLRWTVRRNYIGSVGVLENDFEIGVAALGSDAGLSKISYGRFSPRQPLCQGSRRVFTPLIFSPIFLAYFSAPPWTCISAAAFLRPFYRS